MVMILTGNLAGRIFPVETWYVDCVAIVTDDCLLAYPLHEVSVQGHN